MPIEIESLRTLLAMMSFYADLFVGLVAILGRLDRAHSVAIATAATLGNESAGSRVVASKEIRDLIRLPASQRAHLEAAELQVSLASFDRLIQAADEPELTLGDVAQSSEQLVVILMDELKLCSFWQVPRQYRHLLKPQLFGAEVAAAFPSAAEDIEEAGNCLAFGRGTACVFHLMRVLERGLRSLAEALNDPNLNPQRNPSWDSVLKKCEAEQRKPIADRAAGWRSDDKFFSEVHATLRAVKDGWRNPSLHVERNYSPEQAFELFVATRSFMRRLATKIHEVPVSSVVEP